MTEESASTSNESGDGPVGEGDYRVRPGDCLNSIAAAAGHRWETIWNDPANDALRNERENPSLLLPGDRLVIPPLRERAVAASAGAKHKFVRRGATSYLNVRVTDDGEPVVNEPYRLDVDGEITEGTTDAEGRVRAPIRGRAQNARLVVSVTESDGTTDELIYDLSLGGVDPIKTPTGVQDRLSNLGYEIGARDGQLGPRTQAALVQFQEREGLDQSGEPDDATRERLLERHGS